MTTAVAEVLSEIQAKKKDGKVSVNRFNKKSFNTLMSALANDSTFVEKVAKVKKGELDSIEEVMVSKSFRDFCKKVLEKGGIDKKESDIVYNDNFTFSTNDMNGLYEFFATAVYEFIKAGNQFEFMPTEDFKGSLYMKHVDETTKTAEAFSPKDRSSLGKFKTTKKAHNVLAVKSSCPSFLKSRTPV